MQKSQVKAKKKKKKKALLKIGKRPGEVAH